MSESRIGNDERRALIKELAKLFGFDAPFGCSPERLFSKVGYPGPITPDWDYRDYYGNSRAGARSLWETAIDQIEAGDRSEGGIEELLRGAIVVYPENEVFSRLVTKLETKVPHSDARETQLRISESMKSAASNPVPSVSVLSHSDSRDAVQQPGHVFISYIREDSNQVDRLQRVLEAARVLVWRDTADLWPGEDWRAKIRHAITDDAFVFLVCFSHRSLARRRSYQNEELILAIEQMRLRPPEEPWLIPVRLDECEIPDRDIGGGRTLRSIQRADLFGERFDDGAARLAEAVKRILRRQGEIF